MNMKKSILWIIGLLFVASFSIVSCDETDGAVDPYFKWEHTKKTLRSSCWFDDGGHLHTKNLSAYWIPELAVVEEISGAVYTVTGSYEGTESFLRKLERITAKKFTEKMEGHE